MAEPTSAAAGFASAGQGLANTLLGAGLSYGFNAMSTSKAHDRQKNMMTRGPTYIMQGLRDAGINPILAAGSSGFGAQSARAPQAGSATIPDPSRASLVGSQKQLLASQTSASNAQAALAEANRRIVAAGQVEADWQAAYNLTPEGQENLRLKRKNDALPNTAAGIASRFLDEQNPFRKGGERWPVRIWDPNKPKGTK